MIEKMKKFTFLVTNSEYDDFVQRIRQLGVVHVDQLQHGASSPQLREAMDRAARFRAALQAVEVRAKQYDLPLQPMQAVQVMDVLERVEELQAQELKLMHSLDETDKCIRQLTPWGDFDPEEIRRLSQATGLRVSFFRCGSKAFRPQWADDCFAIPVNEWNKSLYFLTFTPEVPQIQAEQLFLPPASLAEYRREREELCARLNAVRGELCHAHAERRVCLEMGHTQARNDIQLEQVRLSDQLVAGDTLRLLVGWVQAGKAEPLTAYLESSHIFYQASDPSEEDVVPVKITNGPFTRLFEPILKMYSLPNYRDIDPAVFFAPFFMLFFGLCLGDGGYGLLVLLGSAAACLFGPAGMRDYARLGMWLGGMTVVCGLLTGTVFGIDLSQQDWAFLAPVKRYFLSDGGVGPIFGYSPMMVISVIIGMVQVLIGMMLKAAKAWQNNGWPAAVATICWVVALIAGIALGALPACGVALPMVVEYALMGVVGVSALGIFFYNNPGSYRRPALGLLSNVGGGVWATYGMATGLLGDLLSYIRLFALGLTGGVLGSVFNSLALDMTSSMPWAVRWLPMLLILLAGHGITLALSIISAFVHPMRLTFVEFFKNADFEGGGKEYTPFCEQPVPGAARVATTEHQNNQ